MVPDRIDAGGKVGPAGDRVHCDPRRPGNPGGCAGLPLFPDRGRPV